MDLGKLGKMADAKMRNFVQLICVPLFRVQSGLKFEVQYVHAEYVCTMPYVLLPQAGGLISACKPYSVCVWT
jgi:hypothetical protein